MLGLHTLGQGYLILFFGGSLFIILNFLRGSFAEGHDAGDHGDADVEVDVHADADVDVHADADVDVHADADVDVDADADVDVDADTDVDTDGDGNHARLGTDKYGALPVSQRGWSRALKFIIGLLSPTNLSLYFTGFGFGGHFALKFFPFIGVFSLIPALFLGWLFTKIFKMAIILMMRYFTSSSHLDNNNIVGHVGEVEASIKDGHTGLITYVIGNKLYNSAAQTSDPTVSIERGSKVLIVDTNEHILIVEPYKELSLEESFSS
ncbi:MAG: hypothetical protein R3D26_11085 [Cyanobacteriota/Melainabacteria group bacterium]